MKVRLLLALLVLFLCGNKSAFAVAVTGATWNVSLLAFVQAAPPGQNIDCNYGDLVCRTTLPQTITANQADGGEIANASATVTGQPLVSVQATASTSPDLPPGVIGAEASASASLTFYAFVSALGQTALTTVPLKFTGIVAETSLADLGGYTTAGASVSITDPATNQTTNIVSNTTGSKSFNTDVDIVVGEEYSITETVSTAAFYTATATAKIDPFLQIDPSCNCAQDFQLEISDQILNVDAVPETSTWAMMIIGFLGLGIMAHRRTSRVPRFA
jgi:hypothetical protein